MDIDAGHALFADVLFGRKPDPIGAKAFTFPSAKPRQSYLAEIGYVGLGIEDSEDDVLHFFTSASHLRGEDYIQQLARAFNFDFEMRITPTGRFLPSARPAMGGDSVGHYTGATGTLGCTVSDEADRMLALSCNHVIANTNRADIGDSVIQPGAGHGGRQVDRIGQLDAFSALLLDGQTENLMDAAVALIDEAADVADGLRPLGPITGVDPKPPRKARVFKAGAATGWTPGQIAFRKVEAVLPHGELEAVMSEQFLIAGTDKPFSAQGDSGAIVVDKDGKALAMIIGISDDERYAVATPIARILEHFAVTIR